MMNEENAVATLDQWDELHRVGWQRGTKDQCDELDQLDDLHRNGWQRNKTKATNYSDIAIQSMQRRKRLASRLLLAIMILAAAYFASEYLFSVDLEEVQNYPSTLQIRIAKEENITRHLSTALPNGRCKVTPQKFAEKDISPTYQASFPGSGARMTWNLVIALTGIAINDDHDHAGVGYDRVVAVKTHYPLDYGRYVEDDPKFRGAILLLRNPMTAVPSFFNFKYERKNHLPNHSTRAPTEDWIKFRDSNLESELNEYQFFVTFWMEKYDSRDKLLIVSYEDLIDYDEGPIAATKIADFLGQTDGVEPIGREDIPCVWHAVVKYKDVVVSKSGIESVNEERKLVPSSPNSLREGPTERPYNSQQLELLKNLVEGLIEQFRHDEEFVAIMSMYMETISSTAALD